MDFVVQKKRQPMRRCRCASSAPPLHLHEALRDQMKSRRADHGEGEMEEEEEGKGATGAATTAADSSALALVRKKNRNTRERSSIQNTVELSTKHSKF